ncbi:MAG: PIN domain-containing protein [Oscillospiraceae bacterium]|nr:PIN domain-containing protein [Oscillospiraceae bacterium]
MAVRKVFVDTNVILDGLLRNPGFVEDSKRVFSCAERGEICAFLSSSSVTDIFYISRKKLTVPVARKAIEVLLNIFEIVSVDESDLRGALTVPISDLEDALQAWCAKKAGAEAIITRNSDDFKGIDIPVISPDKFLKT